MQTNIILHKLPIKILYSQKIYENTDLQINGNKKVIIWKLKNSSCFKNLYMLPCMYDYNTYSSMTTDIYKNFSKVQMINMCSKEENLY